MKSDKLQTTALAGFLVVLGVASPAMSQEAPPAAPTTSNAEIVVTGSNIRGASDSGAIAVSILNRDVIDTLEGSSTGELLQNIPQAGAFEINQAADGPNDARGDIATVNLRGLGTGNTLLLLNGRRIAAHAVNQDIGSTPRQITNVNAFPSAGVNRFEVLRDGASALYGSDATAGVVNTILEADLKGTRLTLEGSTLDGTDHEDYGFDIAHGFRLNGGKTKVLLVGSYFTRNGLYSKELGPQFDSVDKRGFLGNSLFATQNTDFRNTSTASPFGEFTVGRVVNGNQFVGQRVRRSTPTPSVNLTSTGGVFHIQPCTFPGTLQQFGQRSADFTCVGLDDSTLDTGLRFDFSANQPNNQLNQGVNIAVDSEQAKGRQLISELDRTNLYGRFEHEVSNDLEVFGELLYYRAETRSSRATQPLDSGLAFLIVPKTNYWNPFGAVGSVNRIPGLNTADVPTDGLDVLVSQWRPTELGARGISTQTETYRALGGVRGSWGDWDWEGAVGVSSNKTTDTENNRISKTLLQAELARSDIGAINPFGGPNANTSAQWDRARISSTNFGETKLMTVDFRADTKSLFQTWAGDVGAAVGAEVRQESYFEDRDPRLDGTIIFSTANVSGTSDVVGVSPTRDSEADRNTYSAFAEALIPLHRGEGFFVNDLTLQVAARGEHFSDLDDSAIKPKVALSWFPVEFLNLRAAYSQGFRVPNLVQLNRGDVSRLNLGVDDFWRGAVTSDAQSDGTAYVPSVRRSNPNLRNEDTETTVIGAIMQLDDVIGASWLKDFRISLDYWSFEQTDVVGAFGDEEALALDFLLRKQGSFNPNVVRADVTAQDLAEFATWNAANPTDQRAAAGVVLFINDPYINLDRQEANGLDLGIAVAFDFGRFGDLDIDIEATQLRTLDVFRNELLAAVGSNPAFGSNFSILSVDRLLLDGNPEYRGSISARYRIGRVGAGLSARYVSEYLDTSADIILPDGSTKFFDVKENTRVSGYLDYRLGADEQYRARFGINNLFDVAPPLLDDSLGYDPSYHSLKGREFYVQLQARF